MANEHLNLECPSCGRNGVGIFLNLNAGRPNDVGSEPGSYARCGTGWRGRWKGGCGYFIGNLSPIRSTAIREWKQILNNAAEARRILGVDLMKQEELKLEVDVGAFIGTTDWLDAADQPPVHVGWYDARLKMSEAEREIRQPAPQRRWWFGDCWSYPVYVGETDGGEECGDLGDRRSWREPGTIEYRGLLKKVV